MANLGVHCHDCHTSLQGKSAYCVACFNKRLRPCHHCLHTDFTVLRRFVRHKHICGPEETCLKCGTCHYGKYFKLECPICKDQRWLLDTGPREVCA